MSVNSGKNSYSTLWGALKQRLSTFGRRSNEREKGFERGWIRGNLGGSVKKLENYGYSKHELPSGSEIYLATLEDDLFFEFDEPKPINSGGRFSEEALNLVKPRTCDHNPFVSNPYCSASPQAVSTSSKDASRVEIPEYMNYEDGPEYELEPITGVSETDRTESAAMKSETAIEVERLPAAPVSAESSGEVFSETVVAEASDNEKCAIEENTSTAKDSLIIELEIMLDNVRPAESVAKEESVEADYSEKSPAIEEPVAVSEETFVKDFDRFHDGPVLYTRRYPELTSPKELPALPSEIEHSTFPNPPCVILLPEAKISVAIHETGIGSVSANIMTISTCDTDHCTLRRYEAFSSADSGESAVTETSSPESCLVNYADFAGYDFLPKTTAPERRQPRSRVSAVLEEPEILHSSFGFSISDICESVKTDGADLPIEENNQEFTESVQDVKYEISSASEIKPKISFMFGTGNRLHNFY
jgi:hypothetical protein